MVRGKKRSAIFVLSSSDSEEDKYFKIKHTRSKPARANTQKRRKRASLTNSSNLSLEESPAVDFDKIKRFCEEVDGVRRPQRPAGSKSIKDLWVNKYKPCSLQELAVHKKKVEELKTLIEERLTTLSLEGKSSSYVILITGPAGVGKSATVQVAAASLGASVHEWNMPTPTLWQEYLHNSSSGLKYTSKLDEFEDFVERIRKYGFVSSSSSTIEGSHTPVILLIDDLPVINGKLAYTRLQRCLHLLIQSVRVPTIISITDYGNDDSLDYTTRYLEDIQSFFQNEGVRKVTFNPVTVNSMKKVLLRICKDEHCDVSGEQIESIAKASGGDIRNAITSLQYFCLKPHQDLSVISNGVSSRLKERKDKLDDWRSLSFGRDENISLFHALGKFLHNKRDDQNSVSSDRDTLPLKEELVRLPLNMEAPESVLHQAHWQSRPIADFLHENVLDFISEEAIDDAWVVPSYLSDVLDFISEEAIDDAWVVSSYLSDADLLMASLNGRVSRNFEASNAVQSAAASVAVRGVLFGNSHPGPSRWHTIRRPMLWNAEQSLRQEKNKMNLQRGNSVNLPDFSAMATELNPVLRRIGYRTAEEFTVYNSSAKMVEDELNKMNLDEINDDEEEDEIEDW